MARPKIPDITRLVNSKDFLVDVGIIMVGFVLIGVASAAGTWGFKYVYNNYLLPDIPNGEKIPY